MGRTVSNNSEFRQSEKEIHVVTARGLVLPIWSFSDLSEC